MATDHEILAILGELEAEETAREARRRGFLRIREVITHYKEVKEQIPIVERNLAAAQQQHTEVTERLQTQLTTLRSELADARVKLTTEREALETDRRAVVGKRNELQQQLTALETSTSKRTNELNLLTKEAEKRLVKAVEAFEDFRKAHVS